MIDLHCHILPGCDDGAPTMADALAMARVAVDNGISHILVTHTTWTVNTLIIRLM